jgi:hypothetical protein
MFKDITPLPSRRSSSSIPDFLYPGEVLKQHERQAEKEGAQ